MHRTQILLQDDQYERLRQQSQASGTAIGELIRRAVDQVYGSMSARDRLRALDDSFGTAEDEDFDGLDGDRYVEQQRPGLDERLRSSLDR